MRILVSNDDGFNAPGIVTLAKHLAEIADVTVVAPDRNRSGASSALTLDNPLSVNQASNGFYFVNGTPTDCVHMALSGVVSERPDMVVSGINNGANMGDDTLYSGTVGAAMEGYLVGIPSFAVSMSQHHATHFESAARITVELIKQHLANPPATPSLLNINVPDLPYDEIKGKQITRLGKRHEAENVIPLNTPRGDTVYWIGAAGQPKEAGEGTDFYAVANKQVSITPLQANLTHHAAITELTEWLK